MTSLLLSELTPQSQQHMSFILATKHLPILVTNLPTVHFILGHDEQQIMCMCALSVTQKGYVDGIHETH